jgi:hypothetical protein
MKRGRSFLLLLVVALGIGAYAYFVESKREVSDSTAGKTEKVWTLDSEKVEQIDVKAASGDVTTLKKSGTDWQITAPVTANADQSAVSSMLSSLSSLESTKVVDDAPADVKPFELDPPRISVALHVSGESQPKEIHLGTKTPTGSDLYAQVKGQPKVFLVGGHLEDQFNRSTFDLRDKAVLKFDQTKVDSLELQPSGGTAVALSKKSSDEWRLARPLDAKADFSVVDGLIGKLSQAQMKAITEPDGTGDLKKYGLDKPQVTAMVGAGSTRATLAIGAIGAETPDGTRYARDLTRPTIFTVEAPLLDDLKKKPDDLRQKMLFEFRSYNAVGFDATHGSQTVTFAKQPGPAQSDGGTGADVWKQTKPVAKDADQAKLTDFLVDLANLKADSFVDRALASGDEYVFTVRFGEANSPREERVIFRKSGSTVHGIRQGEPGAAVVATADFDKVAGELKGLTEAK